MLTAEHSRESCFEETNGAENMSSVEDDDLVWELQQHRDNPKYFAELYRRFAPRIHGCIWKRSGDFHFAEDIVQETFRLAYERLHSFQGNSRISTWLHRIAFNKSCEWYRRRPRSTSFVDREVLETMGKHYNPRYLLPSEYAEKYEEEGMVRGLINELGGDYKDVLILRYYESLSYDNIAETLGIPI